MRFFALTIAVILSSQIFAQYDTIAKFELNIHGGIAFPLRNNISEEGIFYCGPTMGATLQYNLSPQFFGAVEYSRSSHDLQWQLYQKPLAATKFNYYGIKFGITQHCNKLFFRQSFGVGPLQFIFESLEQTEPYYLSYHANSAWSIAATTDVTCGYSFSDFFAVTASAGFAMSSINWVMHYYGVSNDEEGSYLIDDTYNKNFHYLPIHFSLGLNFRI